MRFWSACRPAAVSSTLAIVGSKRSSRIYSSASGRFGGSPPIIHSSFVEFVDTYDAFILDQFGVLHNGLHALDGAIEAVEYLYKKNKKLIILSNTSAPASNAISKLSKLGFNKDWFVGAVTSGEEASRYVRATYGSDDSLSAKAVFLSWNALVPDNPRLTAAPQTFLDQCGNVVVTDTIAEADVILLHGSEVWYRGESTPQEFLGTFLDHGGYEVVDPILAQCLASNLPMVCANPDRIVLTPRGEAAHMPGKIAQRYIDMGGRCRSFGKPDVEHFEACLDTLEMVDRRLRVAHVGDSLHHDVVGARTAGIPSVFVASGIHANQLEISFGDMPTSEALDQLFANEGSIYPTHVVSSFQL